jgi:hypothetical protein
VLVGIAAALAAILAVSALLALIFAGSDGEDGAVSFTLTGLSVAPIHGVPPPFPDAVRDQVMATLNAYLDRGVIQPLKSGSTPSGVSELFTPAAAARLGGPDAPAVAETTGSKAKVKAQRANVALTALAGVGGPEVVTAQLDIILELDGQVLLRGGELVLVPTPVGWRIDGYELSAQRGRPA